MITKEKRQELRMLAAKATSGHWTNRGVGGVSGVFAEDKRLNGGFFVAECYGPGADSNSRFIAALNPRVVLALLDQLELAEATTERCRSVASALLDGSVQEVVDREGRADGYRCAHCSLRAETHYEVEGGAHDAECIVHTAKAMLVAAPAALEG